MHKHDKVRTSYRKAKSLLEKIEKMLDEHAYCIDIMQQNLAVMGLLRSAHQNLLEGHLNSCFRTAMESDNEKKKRAMIEEMLKVSHLSNK